jgi:lysophospholipase L1-like esterase
MRRRAIITSQYENETISLVNRMSFEPSTKHIMLIDKTIKDLKDAGIWQKLSVLYIFEAYNRIDAKLNWISNNFNATEPVAPTFIANYGFKGNGLSAYLNTNYNANDDDNYNLNDCCVGCNIKAITPIISGTKDWTMVGAANNATTQISYMPNRKATHQVVCIHTSYDALAYLSITAVTGIATITRDTEGSFNLYQNISTKVNSQKAADGNIPDGNIYLLASNDIANSNNPVNFSPDAIGGFWIGSSITSEQHDLLVGILNNYSSEVNKDITDNTLVIGDSTIASYLEQNAVSSYLKVTGTLTDISDPGDTILQQQTLYENLNSGVKSAVALAFIQIGLNDLDVNETASTAMGRYQTLINTIIAGSPNATIILGTMIPVKQRLIDVLGAEDGLVAYAKWLNMNEAIRGNNAYKITGADGYIDYHTNIMNDGDGNLLASFDMGDHVHPNNEGRSIIAQCWKEFL